MSSSDRTDEPNSILAGLASATVFFAASVGVSLEQISKATGIGPTALMDPNARIPQRFFFEVLQLLEGVRPGRNVSLELASTVPMTFLGTPWRLIGRSPDLRSVLQLLEQHGDLIVDRLEFDLMDESAETRLRVHHPYDEVDGGLGGEFIMAFGTRVLRDTFGDDVIHRVQFPHPARSPLPVYENFFGVPVSFEAECNALVFLVEALDRPNSRALTHLHVSTSRSLFQLRREMGVGEPNGLADVYLAIDMNAMSGDYSVTGLADRMAMSTRNLQRRLRAEGHSARQLLDEARYVRAMDLLSDGRLSIDSVASRLGFKGERAFRKAFQRWSGKSPAQARRELGDG